MILFGSKGTSVNCDTCLRAVRSFRDDIDAIREMPAPIKQGARIRLHELEMRVLRMDKQCKEFEKQFEDSYDDIVQAKSRFRGSLMEIWFAAWDIASRAKASAVMRHRAARRARAASEAEHRQNFLDVLPHVL